MPITSSTFELGPVQVDGRRWVVETHFCQNREPFVINYLGDENTNYQALMDARVGILNHELVIEETEDVLSLDDLRALRELTVQQFLLRFREIYKGSDRADTCKLSWWILRRITAGHVTDAQCRSAFNLTNTQWNNFKTNKLTPRAEAWAGILAATGD